ncbi:MAG: GNAT family N-acetyltransferase [Oscillospiraceae bacterium]
MLLVKQGGQIIGNASVERLPRRMRHRGSIGISVLKAHWGRGIGSALMAQLIAFARENGFAQLELEVRSDNARAIRIYEKFGFQKLCTHPDFFRIGGQRFDFDWMLLPWIK